MKIKVHVFTLLFAASALVTVQAATKSPEQTFARKAAAGGMFEVKLGEVAQKNAASPAVKEFGAMMVTDHGKAGAELAAIAGKENIKLPAELPKKLQAKVDKLSALEGKAFDSAYVADMVADHEKDLAEFKSAAKDLTDPQLKEFAQKTSVVIEHHLEAIKKIQAGMK
jgi:putative membrane protein